MQSKKTPGRKTCAKTKEKELMLKETYNVHNLNKFCNQRSCKALYEGEGTQRSCMKNYKKKTYTKT